jgi:hypothetical protein
VTPEQLVLMESLAKELDCGREEDADALSALLAEREHLLAIIGDDLLPRYEAACEYCRGSRFACNRMVDRLGMAGCIAPYVRALAAPADAAPPNECV